MPNLLYNEVMVVEATKTMKIIMDSQNPRNRRVQ